LSFTDKTDNPKISSVMSINKPTYDELQARCDDLQGQVIRFLKVEQDLINTRNSLDLDLARFRAIQSYSQKVIQAETLKDFAEITVESVVETFELECSAFFLSEKTNSLKVEALIGFDVAVEEACTLDVEWIASRGFHRGGKAIIEKVQPDSVPMGTLELSQVILSPYYNDDGDLHGMLMGGISESKEDYYEEITEELIPSFMVFTQQMSSLLQNFEVKQYLDLKVQKRTAEVVRQKKEIEEMNEELIQQKEELQTTNEKLEEQTNELHKTLESLKMAQSQLVQSEKMASIGQLVAGIAHEINNPVTFISAGVDSLNTNLQEVRQVLDLYHKITPVNVAEKLKNIDELKENIDYNEAIREIGKLVDSIQHGTERTTEIIKGLRTFSRLDEDVLKTTGIHEGLDSTLILLHNKYKNRIEIIKKYDELPEVECYPGQLNQVFMNVLSNAIDAIDDKGTITISTSKSNGSIRISIKDTGRGIPDDIQSKIFEPFFTTKEVGQGTGLGLSICHSIINQHHGKIEVKSGIGKGSEFVIRLPVNQS
jgi:signal transduction histidine kinase